MQAMLLAFVGDIDNDIYQSQRAIEIITLVKELTGLYQGVTEESNMGEGDADQAEIQLIENKNALHLIEIIKNTDQGFSARSFHSVIEII
jgi:hypothetical protein